jgi:TorA maturation chaperone TorD
VGGRVEEAGRLALASLGDGHDPRSLEEAYSLLFGGPDPLHDMPRVPPSATDYLTDDPERTRSAVLGLYRDLGFVDVDVRLEPREPCHVVNELEFIAHCLDLASYELPNALRVAQEFATVHLTPWGVLFAAATAARAEHPVHRFAGLVLEQMLCCESNIVQCGPAYDSSDCYV